MDLKHTDIMNKLLPGAFTDPGQKGETTDEKSD
jgi:hypothetical protein